MTEHTVNRKQLSLRLSLLGFTTLFSISGHQRRFRHRAWKVRQILLKGSNFGLGFFLRAVNLRHRTHDFISLPKEVILRIKKKLNPWRYSSEELRPTETVAARWLQGALWLANRLSLNLNFSFLNRIRYFSYQVATQLSSRGWVHPFQTLYFQKNF